MNLVQQKGSYNTYLEKEASILLFDGVDSNCPVVIFLFLSIVNKRISNTTMDAIFFAICDKVIIKDQNSKMPNLRVEAWQALKECSLDYITYDACPCNPFLFYGKNNSI